MESSRNVIKNRKKNDEKDYFVFYGAYYGAVSGRLLDKSIPQRINTRRTARFFCRSTAPTDEAGKTLVVYYSATGNTENVANYIATATDGDLFELEPAEPYSDADLNWTDDNSRVVREHDNPDERDIALVKNTVENWDEYDTIFIGYPIWWGIAAWPVNGFIEANDFTGKTVIPFCTSSSSGLGESGELLAEMAGTGDWQEGQRFRSGASESDVAAWVESLEK